MNNRLADKLQIWGIEDNINIFSDGSMGFGYHVVPIDISSFSTEKINQLSEQLSTFLNNLPENIDIQFIQDIKGGNSRVLSKHNELIDNSSTEEAKAMTYERLSILTEEDKNSYLPIHSLKILVRKSPAHRAHKKTPLSMLGVNKNSLQDSFSFEFKQTKKLRNEIKNSLKHIDLKSSGIDTNEMLSLIYSQWNPARSVGIGKVNPTDISSSLVLSDVKKDKNVFYIDDMAHKVISLKNLPDITYSSMAIALRSLPFDSRLFLSIHIPEQSKEIERLQTQRRFTFSMVAGQKTGVADIESNAKLEDIESLLSDMLTNGERIFKTGLNILIRSKDIEKLESDTQEVLLKLRELSGAEGLVESYAAFDTFCDFSIPNCRVSERQKNVKTSNLRDLLPIYGPWCGHDKPSILLKSPMGSLFSFDIFDGSHSNANQLISGGSGAGKSFMTNLLLMQKLKENPKIYFIDIGGSYQKICENLEGQYIPLNNNGNLSINPFDLLPNETKPSNQKVKFLLGLVELMVKDDEKTLSRFIRSEIEQAIYHVYEQSQSPRLSDLKSILDESEELEVRQIAKILNSWCGNSVYGQFIDQVTSISLEKSLIAFDLKGLESFPDLQSVCLYMITDLVWREVQLDRSKQKFLVLDECWKLLKYESGLTFIEEVFRTFRKYNASAVAISQDIDDFAKSKIAGAIMPNCSIKWVLMQQKTGSTRVKDVLGLNDNELSQINSLRQEKGVYSEAYLISGTDKRCIVIIEPTPLELWLATTDPKDLSAIEKEELKFPEQPKLEILKLLAQKFPRGISYAEKQGLV